MTIGDKIRDKKLLYDINREAPKILLSSSKINNYKYLKRKETITSNQCRILE